MIANCPTFVCAVVRQCPFLFGVAVTLVMDLMTVVGDVRVFMVPTSLVKSGSPDTVLLCKTVSPLVTVPNRTVSNTSRS